jgi:heme exporter protein CcmD
MSHWLFVIAAYAITGAGLFGILILSFTNMRRAERRVDALRQDQ